MRKTRARRDPPGVSAGSPVSTAEALIDCPDCGTLQRMPAVPAEGVVNCVRCRTVLERSSGRSLDAALACAASGLLLLIPANLAPFLTTSVLGVSRQSILSSSATAMLQNGWPTLALVIGLFVVVLPFFRFGLLTAVLGSLRLKLRPGWLGPAFRWANTLQVWAMPDVFLLGLAVAYARLKSSIAVEVGVGAKCFIAVGVLALFMRAVLDKTAVWRAISPDRERVAGTDALTCTACELPLPASMEGCACPRCAARLQRRKPESLGRAAALTLGALILYIPANLYPLATLPIGLTPTKYTVLEGVIDLAQAGLLGLALLVFCASFAIPFLKLVGLGWCMTSVLRRSARGLVFKTRLYHVVEEVGRWSMVDPFVIACFVPVMQYNSLIYGRAEAAAVPFTGVVVLTMIAARCFDPRRMWDAARTPRKDARLSDAEDRPQDAPLQATRKRTLWPGLVWAVPLAALLIVAWLGLRALSDQGVDVVVTFANADGVKVGDTKVVYQGIEAGRVTHILLNRDGRRVDLTLRLDARSRPALNSGTRFWMIGANPSITDIASVKAALAGVTIGMAPGRGVPQRRFVGLNQAPVIPPGSKGKAFVLTAQNLGSVRAGAPVLYHGQEIGKVTRTDFTGVGVFRIDIFVLQPYDALVRPGALFSASSPLSVSLTGAGISTSFAPAAAVLGGGVDFDLPVSAEHEAPSPAGSRFTLYDNMSNAQQDLSGPTALYSLVFQSKAGPVSQGAGVLVGGYQVGEVRSARLMFHPDTGLPYTAVVAALYTRKLDVPTSQQDGRAGADAAVSRLLAHGYRARLAQSPPLIGGRNISLEPGSVHTATALQTGATYPLIPADPAAGGDVDQITSEAAQILAKVNNIPLEQIGADVRQITGKLRTLVSSPQLSDSLNHLDSTLNQVDQMVTQVKPQVGPLITKLDQAADQLTGVTAAARGVLSGEGASQDASLPGAIQQLTEAARSIRSLADYLGRHPEAIVRGKLKEAK